MRLRRWARGVFVTVAGGGIIKHWAPLFKSESPSQVICVIKASWWKKKQNNLEWFCQAQFQLENAVEIELCSAVSSLPHSPPIW
jgi:hypothetical protein